LNALAEKLLVSRIHRKPEDAALPAWQLAPLGLQDDDWRGLLKGGFVTADGESPSQLTLTDSGLALLQSAIPCGALRPAFDRASRKLVVAGRAVLTLPVQARNLAAFLGALEDRDWAPRVVEPLNGRPCAGDSSSVAVTAYRLSTRQALIDFHADDGAATWNWRCASKNNPCANGA
jgi:hypothetical protein